MAEPFAITTPSASIPMEDGRRGQATFSVVNVSGRALRGRASVVPRDGARPEWFAISGRVEREFPPSGLEQYEVEIAVPPEAPAGTYGFRLDMLGADDPDELQSHGEWVSFQVRPVAQPRRLPWLWIAIAIGVLAALIIGGVVAFAVTRPSPSPTPVPTTPATASPTPTAPPSPSPTPTRPSTVAVPDLIDVRDDQVRSILQTAGLVLISDFGVPDPTCLHPNTIASQSPPPGTQVAAGSGVSVTHGVPPAPPMVCPSSLAGADPERDLAPADVAADPRGRNRRPRPRPGIEERARHGANQPVLSTSAITPDARPEAFQVGRGATGAPPQTQR